ncbi:MAG: ATP-binding protein [Elusimicrobia bacterium]|nr:ATP-binding protein [Elusimicrobiota bacterium]MBU2614872.1 ATP-binding protein [Elusimicrobiota bacterium]
MQGKNKPLLRYLDSSISGLLKKKYSALILGPRQVGKTTLVKKALKECENTAEYPLQNPSVRIDLEANPSKLINQIQALEKKPVVFIDEAQKIPEILDSVQYLIDDNKASFIITGSSARKLKRSSANLLPGRLKRFHLDPLLWGELGLVRKGNISGIETYNINKDLKYSFEDSLVFGSLPGIALLPESDREDFLKAYAETYLEEEIRAEALSRKLGAFSRFLELAAAESGNSPNLTKLSNESGVSHPAIKEFYNVLIDTLVAEKVEPYLKNARKRILSLPKYYFFDLGVRNVLARLPMNSKLVNAQKGILFEHAVVLEIIRRIRALNKSYKVCFWRTSAGAEVDCIIDMGDEVIPVEIKSSANISLSEIKGLRIFLQDYKNIAKHGYVITLGNKKEMLAPNITAIPWMDL